jgi:hypothetical protein
MGNEKHDRALISRSTQPGPANTDKIGQLVEILNVAEWPDDFEKNQKRNELVELLSNAEVEVALEQVLDREFGNEWRLSLHNKLVSLVEKICDNQRIISSPAYWKLAHAAEYSGSYYQVDDYLRGKMALMYHGISSAIPQYLACGIKAPKTEDDFSLWGQQDISLGRSSFGSNYREARHWVFGRPALVVDCGQLDRTKIDPGDPHATAHPTFEGDFSPEAIVGIVATDEKSKHGEPAKKSKTGLRFPFVAIQFSKGIQQHWCL